MSSFETSVWNKYPGNECQTPFSARCRLNAPDSCPAKPGWTDLCESLRGFTNFPFISTSYCVSATVTFGKNLLFEGDSRPC